MLEQGHNEERKLKIGHRTKDGTTYIPFFAQNLYTLKQIILENIVA